MGVKIISNKIVNPSETSQAIANLWLKNTLVVPGKKHALLSATWKLGVSSEQMKNLLLENLPTRYWDNVEEKQALWSAALWNLHGALENGLLLPICSVF